MESRKTYGELLTKPDLNEEEQEKILEFEKFITNAKKYEPYTNDYTKNIIRSYEHEIEFLKGLQEHEKNENIKRTIQNGEQITSITSILDQRIQKKEEKEQQIYTLQKRKEKRAGYLNASILIFIVSNFGLFLAAILLCLM